MKTMMKLCLTFVAGAMLTAFLSACGSNAQVASSTLPAVFYAHNVAFRNSTAMAWGNNGFGQLGNTGLLNTNSNNYNGLPSDSLVPVPVSLLPGVTLAGISAGGTHTLAFDSNGNAYGWGNNGFGQVGNNSGVAQTSPAQVLKTVITNGIASYPALSGIIAVSAGGNHSLALDNNHTIWAWGNNYYGQLGDTTTISRATAVQVLDPATGAPLSQATQISAGGSHSLSVVGTGVDARAYAWGYNGFGQLGNALRPVFQNISTSNLTSPSAVTDTSNNALRNVISVAAGGSHSLIIATNNDIDPVTVWACGYNFLGQLGQGNTSSGTPDTTDRNHGAVKVLNLPTTHGTPVAVAAGLDHSLVLMSDGTVFGWGYNFFGQVGNGQSNTNIPVVVPTQVMIGNNTPLSNVIQIVAVGNNSLAVAMDSATRRKTVYTWGDNTFGQLGNNTGGPGFYSAVAVPIYSYP